MRPGVVFVGLLVLILIFLPSLARAADDQIGCCCPSGYNQWYGSSSCQQSTYYVFESECPGTGASVFLPMSSDTDLRAWDCAELYCWATCLGSHSGGLCGNGLQDLGEECDVNPNTGSTVFFTTCSDGTTNGLNCNTNTCHIGTNNCPQTCTIGQCLPQEPLLCQLDSQGTKIGVPDESCCPAERPNLVNGECISDTTPPPPQTCQNQGHVCCDAGRTQGTQYPSLTCSGSQICAQACQPTTPLPHCDTDGDLYLSTAASCSGTDCNDNNRNIWPDNPNVDCDCTGSQGAPEACGDNRDNDCDGIVDDGCAQSCTPAWQCAPTPGTACINGLQQEMCVDTSSCGQTTYTRDVPCTASVCGNGVIDTGEDCEVSDGALVPGSQCSSATSCYSCQCVEAGCGDTICSRSEQTCEGANLCDECQGWRDANCAPCSDHPAPTLTVNDVYLERTLDLAWSLASSCPNLNRFILVRAMYPTKPAVVPSADGLEYIATPDAEATTYQDTTIEPDAGYCYAIKAVFDDNQESPWSPVVCDDTGNKECLAPESEESWCTTEDTNPPLSKAVLCQHDLPGTADIDEDNKAVIDECDTGQTCVIDEEDLAQCYAQAECDFCNGIYGLFSPYDILIEGPLVELLCSEPRSTCALQSTKTIVDKYGACSDVGSCYDYTTPGQCVSDPCDRNLGCAWQPISGSFTNGVCQPLDETQHECFRCDELGEDCTQEACQQFGACHLDAQNNGLSDWNKHCLPEAEFACRYYDTADECEGGQLIDIDVTYTSSGTSGTNARSTGTGPASQGTLGRGICVWDDAGDYCYKDSDERLLGTATGQLKDDCMEDTASRARYGDPCFYDSTHPETGMNAPLLAGLNFPISYRATDDNSGVKKTYYCIGPADQDCYPDVELNPASTGTPIRLTVPPEATGTSHVLRYFSVDNARNLEPVKEITLNVDALSPIIITDFTVTMRNLAAENWVGDVTIIWSVEDQNDANCSAHLFQGAREQMTVLGIVNDAVPAGIPKGYTVNYPGLPQGTYEYQIVCEDTAHNKNTVQLPIIVDDDMSIQDPSPQYITFNSIVKPVLSVKTIQDGECRVALAKTADSGILLLTPAFSSMIAMTKTQNADGYTHTKQFTGWNDLGTIPSQLGSPPFNNNFLKFWVSCQFGTELTEGNPEDMISFIIDATPPQTRMTNADGSPYNPLEIKQAHIFNLRCDDPIILSDTGNAPRNFGCAYLYTSLQDCTANQHCASENTTQNPRTYTITDRTDFSYHSTDEGNNTETWTNVVLQADGIGPEITIAVFRNDKNTTTLFPGTHRIIITTDEPARMMSVLLKPVDKPAIQLNVEQTGPREWQGVFIINTTTFPNYDKNAIIEAKANDTAGNVGIGTLGVRITTSLPPAPLFDPLLSVYSAFTYPVMTYNNTYYTNKDALFVSGRYFPQTLIELFAVHELSEVGSTTSITFDQSGNSPDDGQELRVSSPAAKGSTTITIDPNYNDPSGLPGTPGYLEISQAPRTLYGMYRQHYTATNIVAQSAGTGVLAIDITLSEPLERDVAAGSLIKFHTRKYPKDYWMGTLAIPESSVPYRLIAGGLSPDGRFVYSEQYPLIVDKDAPSIIAVPGTVLAVLGTNNNRLAFNATISEPNLDPRPGAVQLHFSGGTITPQITRINANSWMISAQVTANLPDGTYTVRITAKDLAGNNATREFLIEIRKNAPSIPQFALSPEGSQSPAPSGKHYTSSIRPVVYLAYNGSGVTIRNFTNADNGNLLPSQCSVTSQQDLPADVRTRFTDGIGTLIACSFTNDFTERTYNVSIRSQFTTPTGPSDASLPHRFAMVIDRTPPGLSLSAPTITRSGVPYEARANLTTSEDELFLRLRVDTNVGIANGTRNGNTFTFTLPETFEWNVPDGDEQTKAVNLSVSDYADNAKTYIQDVVVDNIKPELENVTVKPRYVLEGPYIVVNLADINITGTTSDDARTICPYAEDGTLIEPCATPACTDETACIDTTQFHLKSRIPFFVLDAETSSLIRLEATDKAGNRLAKDLLILADSLGPIPIRITITNQQLGPTQEEPTLQEEDANERAVDTPADRGAQNDILEMP